MSDNGTTPDQYARSRIDEIHAIVAGLTTDVGTLDQRIAQWKTTTNTALNQLSQWDAQDFKEREKRQARLDHELRLLRWGVGISLLLLVVIISLFIGYRLR